MELIDAFMQQSNWELVAALLGVFYIVLATKENAWGWFAAFFGTFIYTLLFWEGQLPMQALLNFYYLIMAIYGFVQWNKHAKSEEVITIYQLSLKAQVLILTAMLVVSAATGAWLAYTESSQAPYLDAFVAIFSVLNTYLLAKKYIESWLYWVVADSAAIWLYWITGYTATILLMAVYVGFSIWGYISWRKKLQAFQN